MNDFGKLNNWYIVEGEFALFSFFSRVVNFFHFCDVLEEDPKDTATIPRGTSLSRTQMIGLGMALLGGARLHHKTMATVLWMGSIVGVQALRGVMGLTADGQGKATEEATENSDTRRLLGATPVYSFILLILLFYVYCIF